MNRHLAIKNWIICLQRYTIQELQKKLMVLHTRAYKSGGPIFVEEDKTVIWMLDSNLLINELDGLAYSYSEFRRPNRWVKDLNLNSNLYLLNMDNVGWIIEVIYPYTISPICPKLFKDNAEYKVGRIPGPNNVPNRALRNLPREEISAFNERA